MKDIKNKLLKNTALILAIVSVSALSSCESDDATGHSSLVPSNPTISVTGTTSISVDERDILIAGVDEVITYTVDMSVPQIVDVAVHVEVLGGTATEDEDFELSTHRVIIPFGETSGSFTVTVLGDSDISEADETFEIQVGGERTANASMSALTINGAITNYAGTLTDSVLVELIWDDGLGFTQEEGSDGEISGDYCDVADFDILAVDTDFSFANFYFGFAMASSDCPETGQFSIAALEADLTAFSTSGANDIFVYLDFFGYSFSDVPGSTFPLSIVYSQLDDYGNVINTASYDVSGIDLSSAAVGAYNGGQISVNAGVMEVYDPAGTLVVSFTAP